MPTAAWPATLGCCRTSTRPYSAFSEALLSGEKIAVYGDFDVDGISATALLVKGLERLGGHVCALYTAPLAGRARPQQLRPGGAPGEGASLVITVDCGITGTAQMQETHKSRLPALDIIITDHHMPLDELPPAVAVVDPKRRDSRYPFTDLAGVGVAYKVLQALYQGLGKEKEVSEFLDLVALGTVADMMPLIGENRYLVKAGLEQLKDTKRPGLRELASQAGVKLEKMDAQDISFGLAPRLNAAGRLEHAISAYNLLVTESAEEAHTLAQVLAEQNNERQRLTAAAMTHAREQVLSKGISPILIARDAGYAGGILGLVAGPAVRRVLSPGGGGAAGRRGVSRQLPQHTGVQHHRGHRQMFGHPDAFRRPCPGGRFHAAHRQPARI